MQTEGIEVSPGVPKKKRNSRVKPKYKDFVANTAGGFYKRTGPKGRGELLLDSIKAKDSLVSPRQVDGIQTEGIELTFLRRTPKFKRVKGANGRRIWEPNNWGPSTAHSIMATFSKEDIPKLIEFLEQFK